MVSLNGSGWWFSHLLQILFPLFGQLDLPVDQGPDKDSQVDYTTWSVACLHFWQTHVHGAFVKWSFDHSLFLVRRWCLMWSIQPTAELFKQSLCIDFTAVGLFWSYLSWRKQVVCVQSCESEPSLLCGHSSRLSTWPTSLHSIHTATVWYGWTSLCPASCLHVTLSCTIQIIASALTLFCNMQNCASLVKKWTIHINLQLNRDKTEALLFDPSSCFKI